MSQKGDCKAIVQLLSDQGNNVQLWCKEEMPLELLTIEGITPINKWTSAINQAEVAILDNASLSRYYSLVSKRIPVVGGARGFDFFLSRQGDVYYRLGIATLPRAQRGIRTTWGLYSDRWLHFGGDTNGGGLLTELSPYLSYIGYRGPFAINWTRYRFSNFLIDSGARMGYDLWVRDNRAIPMEMQLKEIIQGWR